MRKFIAAIAATIAVACAVLPAFAQWQVPTDTVPRGRGAGVTGFATSAVTIDSSNNVTGVASLWSSKALTAVPTDAGGSTPSVNLFRVTSDNVAAGTGFIITGQRRGIAGGSAMTGGRIAGYDFMAITAASSASNTNRNYVGTVSVAYTAVGDGGTNTGAGALGGFFGANPLVHLDTGATNIFDAVGSEVDITISTGASTRFASGLAVVGFNAVRGAELDAAIRISGGAGHIGFKHGIIFTDVNRDTTENPFYADSVLVDSYWLGSTPTVAHGVRLTGFTITGNAFSSTNFSVTGAGVLTAASYTNHLGAFAATTSAQLAGVISDETGSGVLVFGTSPTFTTQITTPKIIGGTAAGDDLTFQTTTGNGSGDTFIWLRGNNGATTAMTLSATTLELGDGVHTFTLGDNGAGQTIIKTDGGSTNASIQVRPRGTGAFGVYNDSAGAVTTFSNNAGATASTNFVDIGNAASGGAPIITVNNSTDTNVSVGLRLQKGTGSLLIQTAAGGEVLSLTSGGAGTGPGAWTILNATAIPAGGTAGSGYKFSSTSNFGIFFGSGAPTLSAAKGSLYLRSDGTTTNNRAYINTDGGTTWTAITTGAWLLERDLNPANDNTPAYMNKVA